MQKFDLSSFDISNGKKVPLSGVKNINEDEYKRRIDNAVRRHDLSLVFKSDIKIVFRNASRSLVGTIYE